MNTVLSNRQRILNKIRQNTSISRAIVAKELNISRSTVSSNVDQLIADDLVSESGKNVANRKGGRRGIQLTFNPNAGYGIGVDIGGTKVLCVMTNLDGEVMFKNRYDTPETPALLLELIDYFIHSAGVSFEDIKTMGLGIAGMVNSSEGIIVHSPNLNWYDVHLKNMLTQKYTFSIYLNNDVNCAIFGEKLKGKGKHCEDFVFIAIGTGIGSAIIANGQLIEGHTYTAGEVGYFVDRKDAIENYKVSLNEYGKLENRLSGTGLNKAYDSSYRLFEDYQLDKPEAVAIVENYVKEIAILIGNIVSFMNPEKVILGGGVAEALQSLLQQIEDQASRITPNRFELTCSSLGNEASAIGAVAYAFNRLQL